MDDLRASLRDLEDEYRRMQGPEVDWNGERLRMLLHTQLRGDQVIVVSNREPHIHEQGADGIVVKRPASGLVTAVEPVMRACSGTWIAHGSGSADREVVDASDRVGVPPGHEDYQLRRIWLTPRKNKAITTALRMKACGRCAMGACAPRLPRIRLGSLQAGQPAICRRRGGRSPQRGSGRPGAGLPLRVAAGHDSRTSAPSHHPHLLAHPWPNPESFGICPWRREILQGMLGSTILGFHTRFHCKNFMETVDRYLEARIEDEHSTISYQDKETLVESYPISIEWPQEALTAAWPPRRNAVNA